MSASLQAFQLDTLLLYLTAFSAAFLTALWFSLVFWAYRDIRARAQGRILHILAAAIVLLLGPAGLVIYLILRPRRTLDEAYQNTLEEEALLTEIEESPTCPGCGARTQHDWQICPQCHTRLRKPCISCGRLMELHWKICPYCAIPTPGMQTVNDRTDPDLPAI
ncbi:MAG: zinc ribbon domain-containing protein [Anaerolineales bacterium]|jgi:RNA polymerase subunit RPABC4/transcription elongation factor Spt4